MDLQSYAKGIIWLCQEFIGKSGMIPFNFADLDNKGTVFLGKPDVTITYDDIQQFVKYTLYYQGLDYIPRYYQSGSKYYMKNN